MDHLPIYLGFDALCLNHFCQHVSLISLLVAFFFQLVSFFIQDLYTAQAGLELTILLPMSSKLWSRRYMPPYAVQQTSFLSRVHSDLCSCSNGEEQRHCVLHLMSFSCSSCFLSRCVSRPHSPLLSLLLYTQYCRYGCRKSGKQNKASTACSVCFTLHCHSTSFP